MSHSRPLADAIQVREGPLLANAARLKYLRIAIAVAYVCGILFSFKLWLSLHRAFPRVALIRGLPTFLSSYDFLLSILLLGALALVAVSRSRRYLLVAIVLVLPLVLFDVSRLQPWVYQYVLMLAVLACGRTGVANSDKTDDDERVLVTLQLIVALLYFWSGTQKLNWSFGHEVMPILLGWAGIHLPAPYLFVPVLGIVAALLEASIGVGLLIRQTRKTAVVMALGMHFILLLILVVAQRNTVVWPWNVAMMIMVVLLFWRSDLSVARGELWRWRGSALAGHAPKAVVIICGLAPALSFAGWWDMYLSGALYSGNTAVAVIRVNDKIRGGFSDKVQQKVFTTSTGELMLPVYEWSMAELNVPPYPEPRAYRQLARAVCAGTPDQKEIELIVKGRPALLDGSCEVTRTPCAELNPR
jgi:hypothetical protein